MFVYQLAVALTHKRCQPGTRSVQLTTKSNYIHSTRHNELSLLRNAGRKCPPLNHGLSLALVHIMNTFGETCIHIYMNYNGYFNHKTFLHCISWKCLTLFITDMFYNHNKNTSHLFLFNSNACECYYGFCLV